eukprot:5909374-Pleurochrysis_carterae.AAC.1
MRTLSACLRILVDGTLERSGRAETLSLRVVPDQPHVDARELSSSRHASWTRSEYHHFIVQATSGRYRIARPRSLVDALPPRACRRRCAGR